MVQPNHADFANNILEKIVQLIDGMAGWSTHQDFLFSEFTYRGLQRDAKKIKDPSMGLAIQALLVLHYNMDVEESMRLFENSVRIGGYDNSWSNMVDGLTTRGFYTQAIALAKRSVLSYKTDRVLQQAAIIGALVHDLDLLAKINQIVGTGNYKSLKEDVMYSLAYTPAAIAFSKKLGLDSASQSEAMAHILDFVAKKDVLIQGVKYFEGDCFDVLPVEIKVKSQSKEDILKINTDLIDFMVSKDYDLLRLAVSVTGNI